MIYPILFCHIFYKLLTIFLTMSELVIVFFLQKSHGLNPAPKSNFKIPLILRFKEHLDNLEIRN